MEITYNLQISTFYDTKPRSLDRILFSIASINIYLCVWLAPQRCANICSITVNLSCYLLSTPPCPQHVPQSLACLTAGQWNSLETFPFPNIHRSNTNNLWNPRLEPLANYKGSCSISFPHPPYQPVQTSLLWQADKKRTDCFKGSNSTTFADGTRTTEKPLPHLFKGFSLRNSI